MKVMKTIQQKVKNAPNGKLLKIFMALSIFLFGGWQSKSIRELNEEQYRLLNDFLEREIHLFHQTSTSKSWAKNINSNWLKEETYFCTLENEDDRQRIINELTEIDFQNNFWSHINSQTVTSLIEQKYLKTSGIKLVKKDDKGVIPKISTPFIYNEMALIYYEDPLEESIFYLKKNKSGKWEWICKFTLHVIFIN